MTPELALAIDACASDSAALIVKLIKKINEVRVFKRKCGQLGAEAKLLNKTLTKNKASIKDFETLERFSTCLDRIEKFVESCTSMGYTEISWEVFFKHEFRRLRKEALALRALFTFESVTETLARQDRGFHEVKTLQNQNIETNRTQNQIICEIRDKLEKDLPVQTQAFASRQISTIRHDFELGESFSLAWSDEKHTSGTGTLEGFGKVVCLEMQIANTTRTFIDIYRDIQEGAFVQRCLGILRNEKKYYVVMEDLEPQLNLAEAISKDRLPESIVSRLNLVYDLAKTMAWYHRAQLLLKSVSDRSVVLRTLPSGDVCPVVTGVENSRHFLEQTSKQIYDARYEAPEYQFVRQHSYYTDIWSLGTIVWQIVSGEMPFESEEPALQKTQARLDIQAILRNSDGNPGSLDSLQELPSVQDIVRQCWSHEPLVRPTAEFVTQALYDAMIQRSSNDQAASEDFQAQKLPGEDNTSEIMVSMTDGASILEKGMEVVVEARRLNTKSKSFVQLQGRSISRTVFESLVNKDDDMNPVRSYAIGAAIWWNVVADYPVSDLLLIGPQFVDADADADEIRALVALSFLEEAASSGYRAAYFEIYKAHAALARSYLALYNKESQDHKPLKSDEAKSQKGDGF